MSVGVVSVGLFIFGVGMYGVWKCMKWGNTWSIDQNLLEHPVQFNYLMCWSKAERISLKMILDFGFLDYCTHSS